MHCHCSTNNRAPRCTFTDPCKPEVRPGAREEAASPASVVKLKMVTGTYMLQSTCAVFNQLENDPACFMCDSETIIHNNAVEFEDIRKPSPEELMCATCISELCAHR